MVNHVKNSLNDAIVFAMLEKQAENIVILDLRNSASSICDYYIICHGNNGPQVQAIAENVIKQTILQLNDKPFRKEGMQNAEWILLDYADVMIHVFHKDKRDYYQIEDLWADAIKQNIATAV